MKKSSKLVLSQETLRNLASDEMRKVVGGTGGPALSNCNCPTTTQALSCIECNPPAN